MQAILASYDRAAGRLAGLAPLLLPLVARLTFAGVLLFYFWNSARTKLGEGFFGFLNPSDAAYIQIFPKAFEAAGYDSSQLGAFHWLVAVAGTTAELLLPLLIVLGLFTRLAAIGKIGFIIVQSVTDIVGHGIGEADIGSWFDGMSDALIVDQRGLWIALLLVLVFLGGGLFSLDRWLTRQGG